jgi:type VI secretion system protein ImpA
MSQIDVDALLRAVDADAPCGPNLEYDPLFVALDQAVLGKPEVQYGATISAAVPPDWKIVRRMAADLLARSRDLRLAVHLLRASLALDGVNGFADGMRLIERLLDEQWQNVHPELDADDDMDPMLRLNSLAILADRATVLKEVKESPLVLLPGLGPFSLRTLEVTNGELAPAHGEAKIALASIELALADMDAATLGAAADALQRSFDSVRNIEVLLVREVGSAQALNLDALTRSLKRGAEFLASQLASRPDAAAPAAAADGPAAALPNGEAPRAAPAGESGGRDDVLRALDRLID